MMKNKLVFLFFVSLLISLSSADFRQPLSQQWSLPLKADDVYCLDGDNDGRFETYAISYGKRGACISVYTYDGTIMRHNCIMGFKRLMYPAASEEILFMYVEDMNHDQILDVFASSNIIGTSVNVKKFYFIQRELEEGAKYEFNLKWDYTPGNVVTDFAVADFDEDSIDELAFSSIDFNVYFLEQNGVLQQKLNVGRAVWSLRAGDVDGDGGVEFVIGTATGVSLLNKSPTALNYSIAWEYTAGERIVSVAFGNVDGGNASEIAAVSEKSAYLLNADGSIRWKKELGKLVDALVKDVNNDGDVDILVLATDGVYMLDSGGEVVWKQQFTEKLKSMHVDPYNYVFIGSEEHLFHFILNQDFLLNQRAEEFYSSAYSYYLAGDIASSRIAAGQAKQLFELAGNVEGSLRCDYLGVVSSSNVSVTRKSWKAVEYYSSAKNLVSEGSFTEAKEYAQLALNLSLELNNKSMIIECDVLLKSIEKKIKEQQKSLAAKHYSDAVNSLAAHMFEEASASAHESYVLYESLGDEQGILRSSELMSKILLEEKRFRADSLILQAADSFEADRFDDALLFVDEAKSIYIGINDSLEASRCDSLIERYGRYGEATAFYEMASESLRFGFPANATFYNQKAREIYLELGDQDKIGDCDFLQRKIDASEQNDLLQFVIFAAPAALVFALIILIRRRKSS